MFNQTFSNRSIVTSSWFFVSTKARRVLSAPAFFSSVGISTAIVWVRRYRQSGEAVARRRGKPRGSRLDAHTELILALVDAGTKDISLAEIVERLKAERGVRVGITSVWKILDRHGLTFKKDRPRAKKDRPRGGAAARGCP